MRDEALFINSVQQSVLQEIIDARPTCRSRRYSSNPTRGRASRNLHDNPPTVDDPMQLYVSAGGKFSTVGCVAEIVGYDDKRAMSAKRRLLVMKAQAVFQPGEEDLIFQTKPVNLIYVRRMRWLAKKEQFSVGRLTKVSDGKPLSADRQSPGGWSYVRRLQG